MLGLSAESRAQNSKNIGLKFVYQRNIPYKILTAVWCPMSLGETPHRKDTEHLYHAFMYSLESHFFLGCMLRVSLVFHTIDLNKCFQTNNICLVIGLSLFIWGK